MIKYIENYPVASLLLFVILMLGFTIDAIPVSIMEARNFISAREMLTDDNWILTTMNGEARYQKPPLPTWITAVFGYVFGIKSVLALRWPALLMIAVVGIGIYKLSLRMQLPKAHSLINACIGITSFYVIGITIEGPWDIYAHGFMLVTIYQLFKMLQDGTVNIMRSLGFVVCLAASILSKGPVSLYVLFLSFTIAFGFSYGYRGKSVNYLKLFALFVFGIAIGGWWYFHVRLADPETFSKIATKETSNWSSYNVRPFYYYWSFFTQSGIWTIPAFIGLLYPYLKTRVTNLKAYTFSVLWTLIAVVLLSVIPEKKSRYLMPVLIPLAITAGFYIEYLIRKFKSMDSQKEVIPVYFNFGLIGVLAVIFPFSGFLFSEYLNGQTLFRFVLLSLVLVSIGIFIFKYLRKKDMKPVFYLVLAFMLSLGLLGLPLAKLQKQKDFKPISTFETKGLKIYAIGGIAPEFIYDYGDKLPNIIASEGYHIPSESEFYVLTHDNTFQNKTPLSVAYTIDYIDTFDMNTASKDKRGHRSRLVGYLYKLTQQKPAF